MNLLDLSGAKALVVGGGLGIGEQSALYLARAGADVAVADVDARRAEHVADLVRAEGRTAVAVVGDVTHDREVAALVDAARDGLGGLNRLVTVVGQATFASSLELSAEQWDLDHSRNLRYVMQVAQPFARGLIAAGEPGAIVCVASVSGMQGAIRHASYGAAKAGLINLVQTLGSEWAPRGIRVNAVAPGSIITPRVPDSPQRAASPTRIPMGRRGSTEDIAGAVLFLLSDLAGYITGHTLPVDGGWTAANLVIGVDSTR